MMCSVQNTAHSVTSVGSSAPLPPPPVLCHALLEYRPRIRCAQFTCCLRSVSSACCSIGDAKLQLVVRPAEGLCLITDSPTAESGVPLLQLQLPAQLVARLVPTAVAQQLSGDWSTAGEDGTDSLRHCWLTARLALTPPLPTPADPTDAAAATASVTLHTTVTASSSSSSSYWPPSVGSLWRVYCANCSNRDTFSTAAADGAGDVATDAGAAAAASGAAAAAGVTSGAAAAAAGGGGGGGVASVRVKRCLPLPTDNWQQAASDAFCCTGVATAPASVATRGRPGCASVHDVLTSTALTVLSVKCLLSGARVAQPLSVADGNNRPPEHSGGGTVLCTGCGHWLGQLAPDGADVSLWRHRVVWRCVLSDSINSSGGGNVSGVLSCKQNGVPATESVCVKEEEKCGDTGGVPVVEVSVSSEQLLWQLLMEHAAQAPTRLLVTTATYGRTGATCCHSDAPSAPSPPAAAATPPPPAAAAAKGLLLQLLDTELVTAVHWAGDSAASSVTTAVSPCPASTTATTASLSASSTSSADTTTIATNFTATSSTSTTYSATSSSEPSASATSNSNSVASATTTSSSSEPSASATSNSSSVASASITTTTSSSLASVAGRSVSLLKLLYQTVDSAVELRRLQRDFSVDLLYVDEQLAQLLARQLLESNQQLAAGQRTVMDKRVGWLMRP